MYQGKFDSRKKTSQISVHELVVQRNKAGKKNPSSTDGASRRSDHRESAKAGYAQARSEKRKGPRIGGMVFYTVFFLCVLVFYTGLYMGMIQLRDWLVSFESAQPTNKSRQVFEMYFQTPDWGQLYDLSVNAQQGSADKEAVVAYMMEKTAGKALTFTETSAGLSGNMKYIVRTGNEKLASFLLIDQNKAEDHSELPDWQLGEIEFFIRDASSYYIQTLEGYQVRVNGAAQNEAHVVGRITTKAEEYLPEGIDGIRIVTYRADGLLTAPEVSVTDHAGSLVEVSYDAEERTYTALPVQQTIPAETEELALNAVKAQCKYSITTAVTDADLAKYFVRGTETFRSMTSMDRQWLQTPRSYDFLNTSVSDYCTYSDELYSVRVSMTMTQTRGDGSVKESDIDASLFFEKQNSGKWLCSNMTAVDVAEREETVRLTFRQEDTVLLDGFYPSDVSQLSCPAVEVPEGKTFTGWVVEQQASGGKTVVDLVFQPDDTGLVTIPSGTVLEPMVLEPLFE